MAYTIYKNIKVVSYQEKLVTPTREVGKENNPEPYTVTVVTLTDVPVAVTFHDFEKSMVVGKTLSVAINDHRQVIALYDHDEKRGNSYQYKTTHYSDWFWLFFMLAFPAVLFASIARKAFQTTKYYGLGWLIAFVGVMCIWGIIRGFVGQFAESKRALAEIERQ